MDEVGAGEEVAGEGARGETAAAGAHQGNAVAVSRILRQLEAVPNKKDRIRSPERKAKRTQTPAERRVEKTHHSDRSGSKIPSMRF
jgi:hypothetical protein